MKLTTRQWITVSGLTWLAIGILLMIKGLKFLTQAMTLIETPPLLKWAAQMAGSVSQGALALICISLFIGFIKGRMILSKTVQRIVLRLENQSSPIEISNAYDRKYLVLLGAMMSLGMLFRFLPIGLDIRGSIDVAIGSALINGAMLYFRESVRPLAQKRKDR
jgi:hypothetical protein